MRVASHRRNLTVWLGFLVLAALPAYADVGFRIEPATPIPQPMALSGVWAVEDAEQDTLFDEEFYFG